MSKIFNQEIDKLQRVAARDTLLFIDDMHLAGNFGAIDLILYLTGCPKFRFILRKDKFIDAYMAILMATRPIKDKLIFRNEFIASLLDATRFKIGTKSYHKTIKALI